MTEMFWMFLISSVIGCIGVSLRMCYKSKCKEFDFCCIKIIRDTQGEEKLDEVDRKNSKETKEDK